MKSVFPLAGLLVLSCAPLFGAEFQGADAMLKKMMEQRNRPADAVKPADPVEELRKKLADFRTQSPAMPPEQAATQWLALFDVFSALPAEALNNPSNFNMYERLSAQSFLEALPPSAAWDALARQIEARKGKDDLREKGLRLLAMVLRGDAVGRDRVMKELRAMVENPKQADPQVGMVYGQVLDTMEEQFELLAEEGAQVASFEKRLARMEEHADRFQGGSLVVPALVKLAGQEKAQALLLRTLALEMEPQIFDEETRRLAARLALQSVDKLKKPLWGLVREIDDGPLYEALAQRFPKADPQFAYYRASAASVYLVSLVAHNRMDEAVKFVAESRGVLQTAQSLMNEGIIDNLVRQGLVRHLNAFLRELLSGDPTLPYWSDFIQLSARLGESDKALAFLREVAVRPNLSAEAQDATSRYYIDALLAADEVDEGLKILRATIQKGPATGAAGADDAETELKKLYANGNVNLPPEALAQLAKMQGGRQGGAMGEHIERCLRLARLGRLLERPELVEEGLAAALTALPKANDNSSQYVMEQLLRLLLDLGRGPDVEKLVTDSPPKQMGGEDYLFGDRTENLAAIYYLAGRHGDVLKLMEQSPFWRAADLSGMSGDEKFGVPVLLAAARALAVAGKMDEARRVVNRLVEVKGGYDPGYALLLELGGDGLEARLDELAKRDRFEERPLIWKAKLQFDAGRLDEAERTVRAAIAIDPSDGEEGKGDRMRAYAVLGDILEKKGDAAQAKIMRGAIEAIRLSENADDWWAVGLLRRAVKMYEAALGHFADAYCIQSRLALRYSELGDLDKAEQHYQRAFELMPESFGRIESHCVGCEGAFSGDQAQNIAERVFTKLASAPGARPQVFYLLGYLRQHENRHAEAVEQFRRAVELDPDYFNAWEHLRESAGGLNRAGSEAEAATLNLLRLDPALTHHQAEFQDVRDLRKLWDAILTAEKIRPAPDDGPIFALPQVAAEVERRQKAMKEAGGNGEFDPRNMAYQEEFMRERQKDLRQPFVQHPVLAGLAGFLEQVSVRQ